MEGWKNNVDWDGDSGESVASGAEGRKMEASTKFAVFDGCSAYNLPTSF